MPYTVINPVCHLLSGWYSNIVNHMDQSGLNFMMSAGFDWSV